MRSSAAESARPGFRDQRGGRGRLTTEHPLYPIEVELKRCHQLHGVVVQRPGDATAFLFLGQKHALEQLASLVVELTQPVNGAPLGGHVADGADHTARCHPPALDLQEPHGAIGRSQRA